MIVVLRHILVLGLPFSKVGGLHCVPHFLNDWKFGVRLIWLRLKG